MWAKKGLHVNHPVTQRSVGFSGWFPVLNLAVIERWRLLIVLHTEYRSQWVSRRLRIGRAWYMYRTQTHKDRREYLSGPQYYVKTHKLSLSRENTTKGYKPKDFCLIIQYTVDYSLSMVCILFCCLFGTVNIYILVSFMFLLFLVEIVFVTLLLKTLLWWDQFELNFWRSKTLIRLGNQYSLC